MKTLTSTAQIEISSFSDDTLTIEVFIVNPDGSRISATEATEEQLPADLSAVAAAAEILEPFYAKVENKEK